MDTKPGFSSCLGNIIVNVVMSICLIFAKGLVLFLVWSWLVTPLFPNMSALTLFQTIAICTVAKIFTSSGLFERDTIDDQYPDKSATERSVYRFVIILGWYAMFLGIAWIIRFMIL